MKDMVQWKMTRIPCIVIVPGCAGYERGKEGKRVKELNSILILIL